MKKILIIQTAFIGDVILATPLVEKLDRFFPEATIDFVLRKGNEGLLAGHPKINKVIIWDKQTKKYNDLLRVAKEIRKSKYDLAINLQRFASSGFLMANSGASIKIGFDKNPFSFSYTKKIPHLIGGGTHEVERNLKLIEEITDNSPQPPKLYPQPADREKIIPYITPPYITLAPASVWFTKQYPIHKWKDLMDVTPEDTTIYLLGGPKDEMICQQLVNESIHKKAVNLAGKLNFLESSALMEKAEMNFVNDSAPLHMASAVNAPVTAVFCSTIPGFGFGPLSEKSKVVETKINLTCRPCGLHGHNACPKGHFKCAETIETRQLEWKQ